MKKYEKNKAILEFDKMIAYIAGKCNSEAGREKVKNIIPFADKSSLQQEFKRVGELKELMQSYGRLPLSSFEDIRVLINRLAPENSYLKAEDLQSIQNSIEIALDVKSFLSKFKDKYPAATAISGKLHELNQLLNNIKFTIEPSGKIFDNASRELKAIRSNIMRLNNEIHVKLERIMKKNRENLREEYITLRDGRFALPVREFSVSKVPGIVHGQSGSGATYFVEPMPVVELNNQVQTLLAEEKKEIIKILRRLSKQVKDYQQELTDNYYLLSEIDALQAKAAYADEIDGIAPEINKEFYWDLRGAKHPLLLKMHPDSTVPLNISIGEKFNVLLISGPNAGGKTVTLKTLGLLQMLFQCGFHIPVKEGSRMPLCEAIFTVIGDEQSIEEDLSTFSSHIRSLNEIIKEVEEKSLVLIDEIGSGTEPTGGAALSIAIMNRLNRFEIATVVTTHQNRLKVYAGETDGIENAAMQFDLETLKPQFRLETGIPGSSYTFEICKRLDVDADILEDARRIAGDESFDMDKLLRDIEKKSRKYYELSDKISIKESELESLIKLYKKKVDEFSRKKSEYEKEAKDQAQDILKNANKLIENTVREIKEKKADKTVITNAKQRIAERKKQLSEQIEEKNIKRSDLINVLENGDTIKSLRYNVTGKVISVFKGRNEIEMERNGFRIIVSAEDIELIKGGRNEPKHEPASEIPKTSGTFNISNELNLRGFTAEEAMRELERYLDYVRSSEWNEVRIIHGKGSGALKNAVHRYLAAVNFIESYRLGRWGEGDSGVTVVLLKN